MGLKHFRTIHTQSIKILMQALLSQHRHVYVSFVVLTLPPLEPARHKGRHMHTVRCSKLSPGEAALARSAGRHTWIAPANNLCAAPSASHSSVSLSTFLACTHRTQLAGQTRKWGGSVWAGVKAAATRAIALRTPCVRITRVRGGERRTMSSQIAASKFPAVLVLRSCSHRVKRGLKGALTDNPGWLHVSRYQIWVVGCVFSLV